MPKIGFFSNLASQPNLAAMVTRKMKHFEHFSFFFNDTLHQCLFHKTKSVIVLCFVVCYFMSVLVLQSS